MNRTDAGRRLAAELEPLRDEHPVVIGLPRGGVPVVCQVARAQGASRVVLAVPVAPPHCLAELRVGADDVVCLELPWDFHAIGQFYADFSQTSDEEGVACLDRAAMRSAAVPAARNAAADPPGRDEDVLIAADSSGCRGT